MRGADYGERATLRVAVPDGDLDAFTGVLAGLTGGEATAVPTGSAWVDG